MPFVEMLMKSVGGDAASQMAGLLNIDPGKAAQILPKVAPLIMGGLKKQQSEPGGEEKVNQLLSKFGGASALDNIGETLRQQATAPTTDATLDGVLGDSGPKAAEMLSKDLGIDAASAQRAIPMVAPLVMGALAKLRDQGGGGLGAVTSLLDKEGNANLLGNLGSLFGGGGGGAQGGGGLLGKALGSMLKGGK